MTFTKKLSLLAAFAVSVFAAENATNNCGKCPAEPPPPPCECAPSCWCQEKELNLMSAYNAPGRIEVHCPWDVFLSGSFIYWQPREKGLDFAYVEPVDADTDTGHLSGVGREYKPGFKAGIGFNFDHDCWTMFVRYTWLHFEENGHASASDTHSLNPRWLDPANDGDDDTYSSISGHWKSRLDLIDLEFGRPFYNGTHLVVRPIMGARGGWINQNYTAVHTIADNLQKQDVHCRQHTWLVGPRIGAGADWLFSCGFRMFCDAAGSLMYQHFSDTFSEDEIYLEALTGGLFSHNKSETSHITPNAEMIIGLGWGSFFDRENWHVDLLAGYEFQYFWGQNEMRAFRDNYHYTVDGAPGDLAYHGLTVTLRLDF